MQIAGLQRESFRCLDDDVGDELGVEFAEVRGIAHLRAVRSNDVVAIARRSVGFKFDLLEFVSAVLVGSVGAGGYVEAHLPVDLVRVMGIGKNGNDFPPRPRGGTDPD